ncbi:uncharacterized protein BXIN_2321 [Babesia sp. Xinjiang]|uniref:uncharacterized protein n=1 Tax=Babesia sp. Xinjiang TaxID=462227 RepID=UPI000A226000|nr:uncharacterized protein BXIN_2321 [Babesia sp. Xinjiang]ORM40798.1 hypothetical protein BXIN_2321 [Babesia sp. Xinjiang]
MAQFLSRAVNDAPNIAKLMNTLDNKIDEMREEANKGFETPSYIFLGPIYEEMLQAITATDVTIAQKWLLAVAFVIKSEMIRLENGGTMPDQASAFFEGLISTLLDTLETLEGKPSLLANDMWITLCKAVSIILKPNVAASVKCHKRMANRTFKFVLQTASTERTEQLLLLLLTWMCSVRSFDGERAEDVVYINQMQMLQRSSNDSTSTDATSLILCNLQKVNKRDPKVLPAFINENVKLVTNELVLGATDKLYRVLQMIGAVLNACKKCDSDIFVDLEPLWNMFDALFQHLGDLSSGTVTEAILLLSLVAKWLGPDLVLVNIQHIQKIVTRLFDHQIDTLMQHATNIEKLLREFDELCSDFYLVMTEQLGRMIEELDKEIDGARFRHAHKLIGIITQLDGASVGHLVEVSVLKLALIYKPHWTDVNVADATIRLIHRHLSTGCSRHTKALRILLAFTKQLRSIVGHHRLADRTILAIGGMLSSTHETNVNTEYTLYTNELQRYMEASMQRRDIETPVEDPTEMSTSPAKRTMRTKQDDIVDAIKKKLRCMRQPVRPDCSTGPYITNQVCNNGCNMSLNSQI